MRHQKVINHMVHTIKKGKKRKQVHATPRQIKAIQIMAENGGNGSQAMIAAGFSPATAKTPSKLTSSKAFQELANEFLPDDLLLGRHQRLLNAHRLDHMVFPLGPKTRDLKKPAKKLTAAQQILQEQEDKLHTSLTDKEIIKMLADLGCSVRRIVHGEQGRHVYFWSPDNKAQHAAIDLGYRVRGKMKENVTVPVQINVNEDRHKYQ